MHLYACKFGHVFLDLIKSIAPPRIKLNINSGDVCGLIPASDDTLQFVLAGQSIRTYEFMCKLFYSELTSGLI